MYKKVIIYMVMIAILLTGCWDQIEIEERADVRLIGIDMYVPPENVQEQTMKGGQSDNALDQPYIFTFVFPEHEIEEMDNIVISSVGKSMYGVSRVLANRTDKQMFLGHLRSIVLNSDVIQDEKKFRSIMGAIESDELISRRVFLLISDEPVQDILNINPDMNPLIGQFIADMLSRKDRTSKVPAGDVGSILKDLHESGNTLIPKIISGETDVKVAGSALIKNYEFVGWLDEVDTMQIMIFKGEADTVGIRGINYKGVNIPIDTRIQHTKLNLVQNEENIKIRAEIQAEGGIKQTYLRGEYDILDSDIVLDIEETAAQLMKEQIESAVDTVQNEFQTDVLNIDRFLRQYHCCVWKEVSDDWEEIFPNIDIEVVFNLKLRRVGLVK